MQTLPPYPALEGRGPFPSDLSRQKWADQRSIHLLSGLPVWHVEGVQDLSQQSCSLAGVGLMCVVATAERNASDLYVHVYCETQLCPGNTLIMAYQERLQCDVTLNVQ